MLVIIAGGESKERAILRHRYAKMELEELDPSVSAQELAAYAGTMTLTGETHAFFLRNILSTKVSEEVSEEVETLRDVLPEIAKGFVESPHTFVLEEEKVPVKAVLEKFKKAGATLELLDAQKKKEPFNAFALADALGKRDRKSLWLGLMMAEREGVAPENIAGILAWKARVALSGARSETDRNMLAKLSRDLVCMYHDSHRGAGELSVLLERFALTL